LYDRFDVVLLSKLAGDYLTGVYSVAYRALGMTQILAYGVLYSLLPELSRNPRGEEERRRLEGAMGFLLGAALAVVLATLALARPAVHFLLGDRYAESVLVLEILIWAVPLRYMNYALNISLLAAGWEKVFVKTSLVCLAVNSIGNLVFIPLYSWRAAAVMTIVTELVLLAQNLYWVRQAVGKIPLPRGWARNSERIGSLTLEGVKPR
jgi:O-antigen/teichoic acid export membrane protein